MASTIFPRLSFAAVIPGLVCLAALSAPLRAQEEQLIRCPVTEVMAEVTTPMPEGWWHAPQLGRITDSRVQQVGGKPVLACLYDVYGKPVAVIRRPPEDAPNCMARAKGYSFVCSADQNSSATAQPVADVCQNLVQDRIEWDYKGSKRWARSNLERLCKDAADSDQPGICFDRVMHGNLSHGGGTRWKWRYALQLCAGTRDAGSTIDCFSSAIDAETPWPQAIEACRADS